MWDTNRPEPAFPFTKTIGWQEHYDGMSLRDYFAAQALTGMLARRTPTDAASNLAVNEAARDAYKFADAMLKVRQKNEASTNAT